MIEQNYFVDINTIRRDEPITFFGIRLGKATISANGIAPHQDEEFVMLDREYDAPETVRKLTSLRQQPKGCLELLSGSDFILGPNIDVEKSTSSLITFGDPYQLRVWVRNTLRRGE